MSSEHGTKRCVCACFQALYMYVQCTDSV